MEWFGICVQMRWNKSVVNCNYVRSCEAVGDCDVR